MGFGASDWVAVFRFYYIVHILSVLVYIPVRYTWLTEKEVITEKSELSAEWMGGVELTREQEIMALMAVAIFLRARKVISAEELVDKFLLFGKGAVTAILYNASTTLVLWYVVFVTVLFLLVRKSKFVGDEDIEYFNTVSFDTKVKKPEGHDRKIMWLVVFYEDWCDKCNVLDPIFAKLSIKYSDARRRWGKVDLARMPEYAEEFKIDVSGFTKQLPTVICFYKGRELRRLPQFTTSGKVIDNAMAEATLIKHFELETDVHTVLHPNSKTSTWRLKEEEQKKKREDLKRKKAGKKPKHED